MNNFKFTTTIVLILLIILNFTFFTKAFAQITPSTSSAFNIKQKIESLKKEIASKAAGLKNEINKKLVNKVWVGKITEISDNKISIKTTSNVDQLKILNYESSATSEAIAKLPEKSILTNEYTILQKNTKKVTKSNLTLKNFNKGDLLIALGDIDDKKNLLSKKVIKMDLFEVDKNEAIAGTVANVNGQIINIKIKDQSLSVVTSNQTGFKNGNDDGALSDIKAGNFIVVVGIKLDKKITARFVYQAISTVSPPSPTPAKTKDSSPSSIQRN